MKDKHFLRLFSLVIAFLLLFNIKPTNNNETETHSQQNYKTSNISQTIDNEQIVSNEVIFNIYDEENNKILERYSVEIGDKIIDKNFNEFEIYSIYENNAYARFTKSYQKPNVIKNQNTKISSEFVSKKIGLYMSHNDESYETGDGYNSIYGAGGIHDVAKKLTNELTKCGIQTYLDETLHIPHDSYAYSRSKVTANKLLQQDLDAIFDIHRDGASRKTYVKTIDNKERCKVRIVVGQTNPNKETNLKFAMDLMSVADQVCPWLFLDIYYAKGHYNQNLKNTSLLFEMGSHLVEKDLVLETVPYLAKVINTTLYNTTVDENNNLTINPTSSSKNTVSTTINETKSHSYILIIIISSVLIMLLAFILFNRFNFITNIKKQLKKKG